MSYGGSRSNPNGPRRPTPYERPVSRNNESFIEKVSQTLYNIIPNSLQNFANRLRGNVSSVTSSTGNSERASNYYRVENLSLDESLPGSASSFGTLNLLSSTPSSSRGLFKIPDSKVIEAEDFPDDGSGTTSGCSSMVHPIDEREYQQEILQLGENSFSRANHMNAKSQFADHEPQIFYDPTPTKPNVKENSHGLMFNDLNGASERRISMPQPMAMSDIKRKTPQFHLLSTTLPDESSDSKKLRKTYFSPFYPGKTKYGGASASRKARFLSRAPYQIDVRSSVKSNPVNESLGEFSNLSSTAMRVYQSLQKMATPLSDAKKMPSFKSSKACDVVNKLSKSSSSSTTVVPNNQPGPPKSMIITPTAAILNDTYYQDPSASVGGKMKCKVTRTHRGPKFSEKAQEEPPPDLSNIKLPPSIVEKFSLESIRPLEKPAFTFAPPISPKCKATGPSTSIEVGGFTFSSPIDVKLRSKGPVKMKQSMDSSMDICSDSKSKPQNALDVLSKLTNSLPKSTVVPFDAVKDLPGRLGENWECEECFVRNEPNALRCIACEGKKPGHIDKLPVTDNSSFKNDKVETSGAWECKECWIQNSSEKEKCAACEAPKPGTQSKKTEMETGEAKTWECDVCMVFNQPNALKCIACEMPKAGPPVSTVGTYTFGTTTVSTPKFQFGIPSQDTKLDEITNNNIHSVFGKAPASGSSTGLGFTFGESKVPVKVDSEDESNASKACNKTEFKFGDLKDTTADSIKNKPVVGQILETSQESNLKPNLLISKLSETTKDSPEILSSPFQIPVSKTDPNKLPTETSANELGSKVSWDSKSRDNLSNSTFNFISSKNEKSSSPQFSFGKSVEGPESKVQTLTNDDAKSAKSVVVESKPENHTFNSKVGFGSPFSFTSPPSIDGKATFNKSPLEPEKGLSTGKESSQFSFGSPFQFGQPTPTAIVSEKNVSNREVEDKVPSTDSTKNQVPSFSSLPVTISSTISNDKNSNVVGNIVGKDPSLFTTCDSNFKASSDKGGFKFIASTASNEQKLIGGFDQGGLSKLSKQSENPFKTGSVMDILNPSSKSEVIKNSDNRSVDSDALVPKDDKKLNFMSNGITMAPSNLFSFGSKSGSATSAISSPFSSPSVDTGSTTVASPALKPDSSLFSFGNSSSISGSNFNSASTADPSKQASFGMPSLTTAATGFKFNTTLTDSKSPVFNGFTSTGTTSNSKPDGLFGNNFQATPFSFSKPIFNGASNSSSLIGNKLGDSSINTPLTTAPSTGIFGSLPTSEFQFSKESKTFSSESGSNSKKPGFCFGSPQTTFSNFGSATCQPSVPTTSSKTGFDFSSSYNLSNLQPNTGAISFNFGAPLPRGNEVFSFTGVQNDNQQSVVANPPTGFQLGTSGQPPFGIGNQPFGNTGPFSLMSNSPLTSENKRPIKKAVRKLNKMS